MITLNASGGSITFEFSGNSTYLNDGTITVPVNSLALIIDESDMISFKKANSNDIFVSANIAEFGMTKAELESWYKENMVGSTGGGGDITSGEVQTMIDQSISGKADTDSLSAYTINEGVAESSQTYNVEVTYSTPVNVYTLDKSYGGIKMFLSHSGSTSSMRPVLICYDDNDNEIGRIWISDRTMASYPFVDYSGFTDLVKNLVDGGYSVIVEGEELTAVKKFTYYEEYWATDEETSVLFFNNAYNITNAVRFDLSKKADSSAVTEEISAAVSGKVDTEDLNISGKTLYVGDYCNGAAYEMAKNYSISTKPTKLLVKTTDDADVTNVVACQLKFDNGTTSGSCILKVSTAVGSGITEAAWQVETPEANLELVNGEVYITFLNGYYLTMFKPGWNGYVMQIVTDIESGSTPSVVESGIYNALDKMSETLTDVITKSDAAYYRGINNPSLYYDISSGITLSSFPISGGDYNYSSIATDASINANNDVLGVYTTGATHAVIKNDSAVSNRIIINSIPSNIKMYWNLSYTGNTSHYIGVSCTVNDGSNGYCQWDWKNNQYVPNDKYINTAVTLSYDSTNQVVTITPSSSSALTSIVYVGCNRNIAPATALTQDDCKIGLVTIDTNSYKLQEALDNKQDTLIAGDNITISGNVISAEGGGKVISGGTNISVTTGETADTINCTLPLTLEGQTLKTNDAINLFKTNSLYVGFNGVGNAYPYSICLGRGCNTYAVKTIAAGDSCSASKEASQAMGKNIIAQNNSEHSVGQYNVSNKSTNAFGSSGNTLFSVGNGGDENSRHNAFEIRQNGDIYLSSGGTDIKLQDYLGGGSITVDSTLDSGSTNPVENQALYDELRIVDNISQRTQLIWEDSGDGVYCFNLPSNCYKIEFVGENENAELDISVNGTKAFVADWSWSGNTWTVSSISQGLTTIIDGSKLTLISTVAFNSIVSGYYTWSYFTTSYAIVESSSVTPLIDKVKEDEQVTAAALNELNARIAALEAIIQNMNN